MIGFNHIDDDKLSSYKTLIDLLKKDIIKCIGESIYWYNIKNKIKEEDKLGEEYSIRINPNCEIFFVYSGRSKPILYFKVTVEEKYVSKLPLSHFNIYEISKMLEDVKNAIFNEK